MAPHLSLPLISRDTSPDADDSNGLKPVTVAGIIVACLAALGVVAWLAFRFFRKRAAAKRENSRGSSFLTVKGVLKEGEQQEEKMSEPSGALGVKGNLFSRDQLTSPSIVLPSKGSLRPNASRDEILQHYTEEGKLPRPFAPFMTGAGATLTPDKRSSNASFLSAARNSFMSIGSSRRFSVASVATTVSSIGSSTGPAGTRKVRQVFNPVLPDELVLSLGERVAIVNSYDDGWCIVGRDGIGGQVELGAVPAWCFIKSSPGLRAERPMRITSLGVTIDINAESGPRHEVMSWSNF